MEKQVNLTITMSEELRYKLKQLALDSRSTLKDVVIKILEEVVNGKA
jgi:hypothetical protein